ncbi:hypothetical protein HYS84_01125 [Candidatus Saccharibacteria bacterium]|nr:hypothetical protein [Candidatus Saccharibacteria bacterium]
MKVNNQNGFAHITIVAAVVVVAVIGGVGYFVIQKNNDDSKSKDATVATSTAASSSATSKASDEAAVKAAAKAHFTLVYQKKYQEAYDNETCKEFRDLASFEKFQSSISSSRGFQTIDLSEVEYSSVDVRNNQAKISGSVGPLDPNSTLDVSLLKKNGQWCIYGYEIK